MRRLLFASSLSVAIAIALAGGHAKADDDDRANTNDADRTFQQGLSLFDAGRISEACSKFAESYAIDSTAIGTLQNLAACHEREGKRVDALREWSDLALKAQQLGKTDRETLAREHVVALTTKIPRLVLHGGSGVARIVIDGDTLEKANWDKPILLDKPGHHEIVFFSSSRRDETRGFDVADGGVVELEIPRFAPTPTPTPTTPTPTATAPPRAQEKSAAPIWITAVGGGFLFAGGFFGVRALQHRSESDDACPANRCTQEGVDLNERAKTEAWVANVGIGVGLVAVGVGVYWLVRQASSR